MRRFCVCAVAAIVLGGIAGCMFHELKPHRLRRWNYGPDGTPDSGYETSISPQSDEPAIYFASIVDKPGRRAR